MYASRKNTWFWSYVWITGSGWVELHRSRRSRDVCSPGSLLVLCGNTQIHSLPLPWREAPRRVVLEEVCSSVWGTSVTSDSFLNVWMGVSQFGPQGKGDTGDEWKDSLQSSCECGGGSGDTADIMKERLCHTTDIIFRQQRCCLTSWLLISPNIISDLKEGHRNQNQVTNRTILLRSNDWCP